MADFSVEVYDGVEVRQTNKVTGQSVDV